MMKLSLRLAVMVFFLTCIGSTLNAALINDFDLNSFDFDITQYNLGSSSDGTGGDALASGTSNGIAWSMTPTSLWSNRTTTDRTFRFTALPVSTDNLHPGGDYTITFDQKIDKLLVAVSNDNTTDSINFGLTPTDTNGVTMSGTQVILNSASGGLVLFEDIQSFTIQNLNTNDDDGYDLAFHAVAAVPVPGSISLLFIGLSGLAAIRRSGFETRSISE